MPTDLNSEMELLKLALDRFDKISGVWNLAAVVGGAIMVFLPNLKSLSRLTWFWIGLAAIGFLTMVGLVLYQISISSQIRAIKSLLKDSSFAQISNQIPDYENWVVWGCGFLIYIAIAFIAARYIFSGENPP